MRVVALITACVMTVMAAVAAEPADGGVKTRFAWGAEFGSSIDLSGHDMSSIDFNAGFGVSHGWLSLAGVGAGANIMVSNSCRTYPIFAIIRTSLSPRRRLVFLDLRGGIALNYLTDNLSKTSPYVSAGLGFNLAGGRNFQSYIVAGYTYNGRGHVETAEIIRDYEPLHYAGIRLGIEF
ncbi:MAG: hypothetical protein Q4C34_09740 [Bacteroidales bacterium]|nr:hypothetical protein [Bacteroidales bacterium]